jgi:Putative auto-transporter adhesin, head GIN domain
MTKLMRNILMLMLALLAGNAYAQDKTIINDKNAQERKLTGFHGVEVSGAIDLYFTQGNEEKVAVSARDADDLDILETEVRGGILYIHYKNSKSWWSNQWNTSGRRFRAYVSCPDISNLTSSGSGNIYLEGKVKTEELKIELSGSGNVEGDITATKLEIEQSGSSNVRIRGIAEKASFSTSGSGNVYGSDLVTDFCEISITGSGNVEVTTNKEISAEVSGSGNIRYRGNASVLHLSTAGTGRIKKID